MRKFAQPFKEEEFRPSRLPQKRPGEKKAIFFLLAATLLLSSFFWFWGSLPERRKEKEILRPLSVATPIQNEKTREEVVAKIREKTLKLQGEYGFYVYNLVGRYEYGYREKDVFTAASLIKLPVILALYQEAEAGKIDLETEYRLKEEDKLPGAGSLYAKPAGTVLTYRKLVELMCQDSDNTAFNIVKKILGEEKIKKTIEEAGMSQTSFEKNKTTPYDIGLFFKKLYTGVISRKARDEILDFLTKTSFEDRLPAGIPEEVRVAHKIGTETGSFSDAGIIFSSKPFILVVLSENASQTQATGAIAEIAKIVFEEETK